MPDGFLADGLADGLDAKLMGGELISATGWHVVNTRPTERADALNIALQQAGYQLTALPLLELVAEPLDAVQQPLAAIDQANVVVVVSPTAAQIGLDYLARLGIEASTLACRWVAVGQATAQILIQAGLQASIPDIETSEGILALSLFNQADLALQVMFWRGHGGRQFMLQQLQNQQHHIISVNLYQRQLPAAATQIYQQLLQHPPQVLIVSSGVSWQHWLSLRQEFGAIELSYVLVLGQRIFQKICKDINCMNHLPQVIALDSLQPDYILEVLHGLSANS